MITTSTFKPAWWLRNAHLQTLWSLIVPTRTCQLALTRERIELPDGDFLDLDWTPGQSGPIIVIVHGLGGSAESAYAQGLLTAAHDAGWRAVVMHFRGCSGEHNRLPRSYHSGETGDISYIVEKIAARDPSVPIMAAGYSLGGNVLLKWLGETHAHNPLTAAVAVSVPFDLSQSSRFMNHGIARLYQHVMVRALQQAVKKKFAHIGSPLDVSHIDEYNTFLSFDNFITAPLHGFKDAHEYYKKSSSRQFLKTIETPTLIIHAVDDPLMPPSVIPEEAELSDAVELELSQRGGHVGFITGFKQSWLEDRIMGYFNLHR